MALEFTAVSVADIKERYSTSRDTALAQFCRKITDTFDAHPEMEGTELYNLEQLEQMDATFQNWQINQRTRRSNPETEQDKTAQVVTVDAIARKINAEKDTTDVRALRRQGGIIFVRNSVYKGTDEDDA